jgi:T5SS/PEP-CTERM-associated repeat protein
MMIPTSTNDVEINAGSADLSTTGQTRDVYIGKASGTSGILTLTSPAELTSRVVYVGDSGTGLASATGANAKWTISSDLNVGRSGSGGLFVSDGAEVSTPHGYIGRDASGFGTVAISGFDSMWTGIVDVGVAGEGIFNLLNSAKATSASAVIGQSSGSEGTVNIEDVAVWTITNHLEVGRQGKATLNIENTSTVQGFSASVGSQTGSDGVVIVDSGSYWFNTGSLQVGSAGSGVVQVLDFGTLTCSNATIGGNSSTAQGSIIVDDTSSWEHSGSLAIVSDGTVSIKNSLLIGTTVATIDGGDIDQRGTMLVEGASSLWSNNGGVTVGNSWYGKLTIADGALVTNTTGMIGSANTSDGEVFVRKGATWNNSGRLTVGNAGKGKLTISEGALVKSNTAIIADAFGQPGIVIVDGVGSKLEVTGTVGGGIGPLQVGDTNGAGTDATLLVRNGGVVMSSGPAPSPLSGQVHMAGKGKLMGDGTVIGSVLNSAGATVAPGYVHEITGNETRGTLHITGDYKQRGGTLQIELGADAYDQLDVSGELSLNFATNKLEVTLDEGFVPLIGQSFNIIDWASTNMDAVFGPTFTTILPALPGGRLWDITQLHTSGVIAVSGFSTVIGDYNGNGVADAADYVMLRRNPGSTPAQYAQWRGNFGNFSGGGAGGIDGAAVPEPTVGLLSLMLATPIFCRRRRHFLVA